LDTQQEDPIPNIDFVGLSVDPLSYLSLGKVGETLDSHLDIILFFWVYNNQKMMNFCRLGVPKLGCFC
jgi:hypothetical protein